MGTEGTIVFDVVVGARFLIPLLIIRFPLPAILAALVLDGVDQTIFQSFGFNPPGYQGYDKAMDVYYLAIAYLSTMRNWTSRSAFGVARFLYFYRLVGVTAFELTEWRPLLLIFPNTFEYFFIAYEIIRLHRDPTRRSRRFWVITAAAIWIFVKLPQEYWIHIAQLDVTDTVAKYPEAAAAVAVIAVVLGLAAWLVIRRRLPPPDWPWRIAADPLPAEIDTAAERDHWVAAHTRVLSAATAEKVVLIGLISVIYGDRDTAGAPDLESPVVPGCCGLRRRERRHQPLDRATVPHTAVDPGSLRRPRHLQRRPRPAGQLVARPRRRRHQPGHHAVLRAPVVPAHLVRRSVPAGGPGAVRDRLAIPRAPCRASPESRRSARPSWCPA
jgi:hypothetical protein